MSHLYVDLMCSASYTTLGLSTVKRSTSTMLAAAGSARTHGPHAHSGLRRAVEPLEAGLLRQHPASPTALHTPAAPRNWIWWLEPGVRVETGCGYGRDAAGNLTGRVCLGNGGGAPRERQPRKCRARIPRREFCLWPLVRTHQRELFSSIVPLAHANGHYDRAPGRGRRRANGGSRRERRRAARGVRYTGARPRLAGGEAGGGRSRAQGHFRGAWRGVSTSALWCPSSA